MSEFESAVYIVAVFCKGTPKAPEEDPGLQELRTQLRLLLAIRQLSGIPVGVVIFGPKTIDDDVSEAQAFKRCLWADGVGLVEGQPDIPCVLVEDTDRVREHVEHLRSLVRPGQRLIVLCDEVALGQVTFHLGNHFGTQNYQVVTVDYCPKSWRPIERWFKQPLRNLSDRLYTRWPRLFGWLDRSARRTNVELARRTER